MSKKKKGSIPVAPPKQEKKMVIDMNQMNLKKEHIIPAFRTGAYQTIKDRPRKKDWKREYERGKGPGKYQSDMDSGSFVIHKNLRNIELSMRNVIFCTLFAMRVSRLMS